MGFLRASVLVLIALALVQRPSSAQAPPPPGCEGLSVAENGFCAALTNCTGLECTLGHTLTATFSIKKCSDPLQISVAVTSPNGVNFFYVFTSSGPQTNGGYTVNLATSRNASYATVEAFGGNGDRIFPYTEVFLEPHMCMCSSLDSLVANINLPITGTCSRNPSCTGVSCALDIQSSGIYGLEVDIEACQNPPGALAVMMDSDGNAVFVEYFNVSKDVTIPIEHPPGPFVLSVDITHQDYSATVEVSIDIGTTITLLPEHQIILDKSDCPVVIPTVDIPTTPPGRVLTQETCDALAEIVDLPFLETLGVKCWASEACDAVTCEVAGFQLYSQLLPCERPPTVFVEISDVNGVIYEMVLNDSSTFFNLENIASIQFLLTTPTSNGLTIQIKIYLGQTSIDLIEEHEIPFNVSFCPSVVDDTSSTSTTSSSRPISSPPSSEPEVNHTSSTSLTMFPSSTTSSSRPISSPPSSEPEVNRISSTTVAAITVPIILLMVLVAIAVVVATIAVVVLKRRKSGPDHQFPFRTMDDEGENDDKKEIFPFRTMDDEGENDDKKEIVESPADEQNIDLVEDVIVDH